MEINKIVPQKGKSKNSGNISWESVTVVSLFLGYMIYYFFFK